MTTISDPRWLELLRAEAGRTSIGAVAGRVGYSRTAISQVMAGKYPGKPERIAAAVLTALEPVLTVDCPHLGTAIEFHVCDQLAGQRAPTHNPVKMQHWRTCRQCPNRKEGV